MPSNTAVVIGVLLLVLLIGAVALVAVMEARGRQPVESAVYVINDAVDFTVETLDPEVLERLGPAGVRRTVEWSTHYLQGLAVPARLRKGLQVVAGGEGSAIEYIRGQLAKQGHEYSTADIAAVLAGEAGYLAGIGALGERVKEQEPV